MDVLTIKTLPSVVRLSDVSLQTNHTCGQVYTVASIRVSAGWFSVVSPGGANMVQCMVRSHEGFS